VKNTGFVETLIETINRSWRFQHIVLPPPPLGHPPIAIIPDKVENNTPKKEGVKGMLPACCLPLGGRVGVTLIAAAENCRMRGEREFQQSENTI
jgi:hypothetical protein